MRHRNRNFARRSSHPVGGSKLRGRLGFYPLLMGRLGHGVMGPLIRRQYGVSATKLTPALKRNLLWRFDAIGVLPAVDTDESGYTRWIPL